MVQFDWSNEKNDWLKRVRGLSFEQVVVLLERDEVLDIVEHPNQKTYPGQMIVLVRIDEHVCLVPFTREGDTIFLKTIIPSRKATSRYRER